MRRVVTSAVTAVCLSAMACAARPVDSRGGAMPDPGGCYVVVYDQPEFMGAREFINGPARHATLNVLPFRADWRHRIRSARVGPGATVTAWVDEVFQGAFMTWDPESLYPSLGPAFSGEVESLNVTCVGPRVNP
jgi:hypothetical protein